MSVELLLDCGQDYISYSEMYAISTQHIFQEQTTFCLRQFIIFYLTFLNKTFTTSLKIQK